MYSFDSNIRYSEVSENCHLTLNGLIDYFQDCSSFHSEEVGLGVGSLNRFHRAWYINAWQIEVDRYPKFCEKVTIQTWPYSFNGFVGLRNYVMRDEKGNCIACANSVWAFINTENGKFAKADEYVKDRYTLEPRFNMVYKDRKIKVPAGGEKLTEVIVNETMIDSNHHMNNEEYVGVATHLLNEYEPHHVRVEYRKSALLGNVLYPVLYRDQNYRILSLCDEGSNPYAVVEFAD